MRYVYDLFINIDIYIKCMILYKYVNNNIKLLKKL